MLSTEGGTSSIDWAAYVAGLIPTSGQAPRTALVVAHPDDEVIGAGAQLPRFRDLFIFHLTDGAPRDMHDAHAHGFDNWRAYADTRRKELEGAMNLAGIPMERLVSLGYPDQEASLHLAELVQILVKRFSDSKIDLVLTHSYEGGHPDHDAAAFVVQMACRILAKSGAPAPSVVEMPFYHSRNGERVVSNFLAHAGSPVSCAQLSVEQRALKKKMFECYRTQEAVMRSFSTEFECFRKAPDYHFEQSPHEGKLFYENYAWGMDSAHWRVLAREARQALEQL